MKTTHRDGGDEPADSNLCAAIIEWAASPNLPVRAPAQGPLLSFRNQKLERAYLQHEYKLNQKGIAVGTLIAMLLVIAFLWLDPLLAPAGGLQIIHATRIYVGIPCAVLLWLGAMLVKNAYLSIPWSASLLVAYGLMHSAELLAIGDTAFIYLSYGIWELVFGTFLLGALPLRWSAAAVLIDVVAFTLCALAVHVDAIQFINYFGVDVVIVFLFCSIAIYRYERASRRQFIAQATAQIQHAERLAAEADRRRWLEVIAAFLRHELKNAITGASTSIELADRADARLIATKFHDRARRSIHYMRRLLTQVADATSLESALKKQDFERLDLSNLVSGRVEDFRSEIQGRSFDTDVAHDIHVLGHADSLVQMLDKLINNAIEHGHPASPICVGLHSRNGAGTLVVSNQGDPLPADIDQIFEPFVSKKRTASAGGNLGLGLFVAREIAKHHGGSVRAIPLPDANGARFTVELPLSLNSEG